jgi:hypothetical protein
LATSGPAYPDTVMVRLKPDATHDIRSVRLQPDLGTYETFVVSGFSRTSDD